MRFKTLTNTVLKLAPVQSVELEEEEKVSLAAGMEYPLQSFAPIDKTNIRVAFSGESFKGRNTWVAYSPHVEILKEDGSKALGVYRKGDVLPKQVNLPVPYYSQRNNKYRPWGTCNVTSVAMCLAYFGIRAKSPSQQLEDELFKQVESKGWDRHLHEHLRKLFNEYGIADRFKTEATWEEVKIHLANGLPVIMSGQFTPSGHIIVIRGYDAAGYRVNDPWGEWFSGGYQNKSGENLFYSQQLMNSISYGGSDTTWAHFPSK